MLRYFVFQFPNRHQNPFLKAVSFLASCSLYFHVFCLSGQRRCWVHRACACFPAWKQQHRKWRCVSATKTASVCLSSPPQLWLQIHYPRSESSSVWECWPFMDTPSFSTHFILFFSWLWHPLISGRRWQRQPMEPVAAVWNTSTLRTGHGYVQCKTISVSLKMQMRWDVTLLTPALP